MKKTMQIVLLLLVSILVLTGCACEHTWAEANCTTPKTCTKCQEVEGAPLGHSWSAATCTAPKTCENCGATEGEALPHTYADATCDTPKTCTDCGATEGEALGHTWVDATYTEPQTCSVCGTTEGTVLVRTDLGMNYDELEEALNASLQLLGMTLEYWGNDEDGWPIYDVLDATTGEYTNVYISFEPNEDGSKVYGLYICAEDVNDTVAVAVLGATGTVGLLAVEPEFDIDAMQQTMAGTPQIVNDMAYYYMEDHGLAMDMQIYTEYVIFWIYPVE